MRASAIPSRIRTSAASVAAALVLCASARSAEGPDGGPPEKDGPPAAPAPRLVVEYLPPLVYAREGIHLRFRVENPAKERADCTVELTLSAGADASEPPGAPAPVRLEVPSGEKRSGGFELPSTGWSRAEVTLSSGGTRAQALVIRRFGEEDKMPPLAAGGERLYVRGSAKGSGPAEAAVVVLRQRVSVDDREWKVIRLLADQLSEGTVPAGVTLLGPALGPAPRDGEKPEQPAYFRTVSAKAGTWVEATALPGEAARGVTNPILADFAAALAALEGSRPAELVIWVVACDDARRATPVRTFRKAADFLMVRARRRSARLAVLFVPEPAVLGSRRAVYSEELRRAASAFKATYARVDALEEAAYWRPEESSRSRGALARYPNAKGHEVLAEAILERIRP